MKTMTSAEFRKTYPRLTVPVRVTANGHPIGEWTPMYAEVTIMAAEDFRIASASDPSLGPRAQQASRDAILRKINRGKG